MSSSSPRAPRKKKPPAEPANWLVCFELDEPDENTHVASFQMLVHANSCDDALEQCERRLRELHATGKHFVQPCSIYLLHAIRLPTVMSGPALVNFSDTVIYREDTGHDHVRRRRPARHRSRQLDDAVRRFAADRTKNRYDRATHTLYVSSIFKWFQEDFERSAGGRLAYVASFAPDSMHPAMSAPRNGQELWIENLIKRRPSRPDLGSSSASPWSSSAA